MTLYWASLYLLIDSDITGDIYKIENILQFTKGEGLILSLDSNARSKLWFDKYTNARGRTMEEYIITRDLHFVNTDSSTPSFETNRGRSWIDLTLCNSKLIQNIRRWTCGEEESCTDHKIICFDIESWGIEENVKEFAQKRYNTKVANWSTFERNLAKNQVRTFQCRTDLHNLTKCEKSLSQKVKNCTDIGDVINKLISAITAACDVRFQVLKTGKRASKERSVPWWNEELTTLRKKHLQ